MGRYEEALKTYKECMIIQESAFGRDHHIFAVTLNNIGDTSYKMGRYEEALKTFKECLVIQ